MIRSPSAREEKGPLEIAGSQGAWQETVAAAASTAHSTNGWDPGGCGCFWPAWSWPVPSPTTCSSRRAT